MILDVLPVYSGGVGCALQVGLKLAAKAGFDIVKAPAVWDDFAEQSPPGMEALSVLQTHPASHNRKTALLHEIASMQRRGWSRKADASTGLWDSVESSRSYFAV